MGKSNAPENSISIGDIICSKAGRDSGRYFVIMWKEDNYVGICDGDLHKTDKIKKKKIRHTVNTNVTSEYIKNKILAAEKVTNSEVRRSLAEYTEKL